MDINIQTDWQKIIESQFEMPYWRDLESKIHYVYKTFTVYPSKDNIFRCFNYFDFENTKVVILGQDPYPTPGDANGLAFSVDRSNNLPPSLKNIFHELENDLKIKRINGDLSDWAKQGVLLLNTSLTYCKQLPELLKIWNTFTKNIISYIDNNLDNVIFVLWGNYANNYTQYIIRNKAFIVSSGHPSFAHSHGKFFNTSPFSKINNLLIKNNKTPITW